MKRILPRFKRPRRRSMIIAAVLFSIWLIWVLQVRSGLAQLEEESWFGDIKNVSVEVERLESPIFWLLPPNVQSRRQGLLGYLHLSPGRDAKALNCYGIEFVCAAGLKLLTPAVMAIIKSPEQAYAGLMKGYAEEKVTLPPLPPRIDTSALAEKLSPLPDEQNAHYAFLKLPHFVQTEELSAASSIGGELAPLLPILEANRETLSQWNNTLDHYHRHRSPAVSEESPTLSLNWLCALNICEAKLALKQGDIDSAVVSLMRVYETFNLMEDDGYLIHLLTSIGLRRQLLSAIDDFSKNIEFKQKCSRILDMHQFDKTCMHRCAAREFESMWESIEKDPVESDKIEGFNTRFLWESERALFRQMSELDRAFVEGYPATIEKPDIFAEMLRSFREGRRAFYWRHEHSQVDTQAAASSLIFVKTIQFQGEIMGMTACPNVGRINEAIRELEALEAEYIERYSQRQNDLTNSQASVKKR